jgi:hypothetical protein
MVMKQEENPFFDFGEEDVQEIDDWIWNDW